MIVLLKFYSVYQLIKLLNYITNYHMYYYRCLKKYDSSELVVNRNYGWSVGKFDYVDNEWITIRDDGVYPKHLSYYIEIDGCSFNISMMMSDVVCAYKSIVGE